MGTLRLRGCSRTIDGLSNTDGQGTVDTRMDASRHLMSAASGYCFDGLDTGRELFVGRSAGGDTLTFVCFRHGYGVRRNGVPVPGATWEATDLDVALAAFQGFVGRSQFPAVPLPAA